MKEGTNKSIKLLVGAVVLLVVILSVSGYFLFVKSSQLKDAEQTNEIAKQQLQDEYQNIATQYEGFKLNVKNDSLLQKLDNEHAKVERLLEELRTVKSTNRVEINRLTVELSTMRKVLKSYVVQIDSLNRVNEQLTKENKEITTKYERTTQTLNQVAQEKANLDQKVTLASKLDATLIAVVATNSKDKPQKKIKKIERLAVSFVISKNITAQPGERTIYVRILKPDNNALVKSAANTFPFENGNITYSMKKNVEYGGEETPVILYWNVEEYLMPGTYRADIFADGNLIGSKTFTLTD